MLAFLLQQQHQALLGLHWHKILPTTIPSPPAATIPAMRRGGVGLLPVPLPLAPVFKNTCTVLHTKKAGRHTIETWRHIKKQQRPPKQKLSLL